MQTRWLIKRFARQGSDVLYYVDTDEPLLALTLDDGPDPVATPKLLDLLCEYKARATFFLIAERIKGNENLVRRLVAEGHEIGNHMSEDRASIRLSVQDFERDLASADAVLSGYGPIRWFRPGSGFYSQSMLAIARRYGYRCALGDVYPFDPVISSVCFITRFILVIARPGSIIILHDVGQRGARTVKALQIVLPALINKGLQLVTVSELLGVGRRAASNPGNFGGWFSTKCVEVPFKRRK